MNKLSLTVNGKLFDIEYQAGESLLDVIRNRVGLTGTKKGCGEGYCGACTVLLNGKPVNSCIILASEAEGARITTIEAVEHNPRWRIFQEKLVENSAGQCGFCIPGMVMNVVSILDEEPDIALDDIKRELTGNICRCGSHHKVLKSVQEYQAEIRKEGIGNAGTQ